MGHQSMMPGGGEGGGSRHQPMMPKGSSRKSPGNDGNLYTNKSRLRQRDYLGNHRGGAKGGAKPSAGIGCFITAACVEAMDLRDDCYELMLLRLFRREYVEKLPDGAQVLAEYREKAPRIVDAINALGPEAARGVWDDLYRNGVRRSVELITNDAWDEAYDLYWRTCADLETRFLAGDQGGKEDRVEA
jgi:hypothetical protein